MTVVLLHSHYDANHLSQVIAEMRELGAPRIHAIWSECHGIWLALEGCHRLRAAEALGLTPEIIEIEVSDPDMDVNDVLPEAFEDPISFAEIMDVGTNPKIITFEE